ncbi:UDP-N-acetylmuramate dehydrogenase [Candidatus Gottesmanbacteria bacterium]|nr:UDP-N-acetylmuramate dehydrogenase [Candidatus Gottesmanbacteria bacterium]
MKIDLLSKLEAKLGPARILPNEILANHCTWRIGGPAKYYFEAKTLAEFVNAVTLSKKLNLPFLILGGGTNTLFPDRGFAGLVIKNGTTKINILAVSGKIKSGKSSQSVYVEAETGVTFNRLVRFTLDEGLSGFESFLGQPGTVGGAMFINAHFPQAKKFVGDFVVSAKVLELNGKTKEVGVDYFRFGYDESIIQHTREIVLSVVFKLNRSTKEKVWEEGNKTTVYRQLTQPQGYPTAGCTFRNITYAEALLLPTPNHTQSAGFLIDQCGLKGHTVGGAQISEKHANFILNKGSARAQDVIDLINLCKEKVKSKFGVELKEEVIIVR